MIWISLPGRGTGPAMGTNAVSARHLLNRTNSRCGADSRAEQQWRMAVENIRAMNLQRQARVGVRLRC